MSPKPKDTILIIILFLSSFSLAFRLKRRRRGICRVLSAFKAAFIFTFASVYCSRMW